MPKTKLTSENIQFIESNYLIMSGNQMAKLFNVDRQVVNRFKRKHGLITPKSVILESVAEIFRNKTTSTPEVDDYIKNNYLLMPQKRIAKNINRSNTFVQTRLRQLNLVIPQEVINSFKKGSQIKPGNVPVNKGKKMSSELRDKISHTFFKKGHSPENTLYDGAIVIRHNHKERNSPPYKWLRIAKGKWVMLHRHIWAQANGKVPDGFIVVFKDRNTMNCDINNLELISFEENMKRNTIHNYPEDIVKAVQTRSQLTKVINKIKNQNNDKKQN